MEIREGFAGQRQVVVPRPVVQQALGRAVTRRLVVTDIGYYPSARHHVVRRPGGTDELVVIVGTAGAGWLRIGGAEHRVLPHRAAVVPPGVPHEYGADADDPWSIWWCHVRGTDAAELVEALGATSARPIVRVRAIDRAVALLDDALTSLERNQSPVRLIGSAGIAWRLMTQLVVDRVDPGAGDPVQRAMAYLAERLDRPIAVAELARLVGLSPSHLTARFRAATGGGVLAHHTALRMARARRLLDSTDATVGAIAAEVGYDDPLYFSRVFRRAHGMSPSAFRERGGGRAPLG